MSVTRRVSFELSDVAGDDMKAAENVQKLLQSRVPVAYKVETLNEKGEVLGANMVVPHSEENFTHTIMRHMPRSYVEVEHLDEQMQVYIASDYFTEMPIDEQREAYVASLFGSLSWDILKDVVFFCYTNEEWAEEFEGEEE